MKAQDVLDATRDVSDRRRSLCVREFEKVIITSGMSEL